MRNEPQYGKEEETSRPALNPHLIANLLSKKYCPQPSMYEAVVEGQVILFTQQVAEHKSKDCSLNINGLDSVVVVLESRI
jgi:hypothetical protein